MTSGSAAALPEPGPEVSPTRDPAPVSRGWIARFGLLYLGQNMAWTAASNLLVANQVLIWFPHAKESHLGWLMGCGGLAAMIANPLAGHLSDRTRTRFGQRLPWIVGGGLAAALTLVLCGLSGSYPMLFVAWVAFQVVLAVSITTSQTVAPDRVPARQYGVVSGVMGLTYTAAVVLGTALGATLGILPAYVASASFVVVLMVPFVLVDRGSVAQQAARRDHSGGPGGRDTWLPRWGAASDFWWVLLARLMVTMAQSLALFYLLYYLRDRIGFDTQRANDGVLQLSLIYALCVVVTALWSGRASDRSGRRKSFVVGSSGGVSVAALLMAWTHSFGAVVVAAVILGLSWGVYQAIDQALINQVLPSRVDRAKDMGLVNLAVAIPNTFAPVVAAFTVTHVGGYVGLYLLAAALTLTGSAMTLRVRGVR